MAPSHLTDSKASTIQCNIVQDRCQAAAHDAMLVPPSTIITVHPKTQHNGNITVTPYHPYANPTNGCMMCLKSGQHGICHIVLVQDFKVLWVLPSSIIHKQGTFSINHHPPSNIQNPTVTTIKLSTPLMANDQQLESNIPIMEQPSHNPPALLTS